MKKPSVEWENLNPVVKDTVSSFHAEIPVKIGNLAKALGLSVKVTTLDVGISGMIEPCNQSASGFKITINKHEPKYRQRFTLAHEIAHYLLHSHLIGVGLADNILYRSKLSDEKEAEANRLASDILMPRSILRSWINQCDQKKPADYVSRISMEFGVSEEAMRISLGLK
ncbi:MAG: ImmA/IrrE family metallo-endopeptidase [Proteobacteria bacterium]|nr:ImmA/IrrE family metallo-endopeptidase [Pseudomonadota bacterium]